MCEIISFCDAKSQKNNDLGNFESNQKDEIKVEEQEDCGPEILFRKKLIASIMKSIQDNVGEDFNLSPSEIDKIRCDALMIVAATMLSPSGTPECYRKAALLFMQIKECLNQNANQAQN